MKDDRHIIWSNHDLDFDDWRDDLEVQYPGLPESELVSLMYNINSGYFVHTSR